MPVIALIIFVPKCSIGTTLYFSNLSLPSSGHSPTHVVSFPNSLFLPMLHILKLLQPSPGEQNSEVLKMQCKRDEKDGLPPRRAGRTPIILSWLAAVKIAL